MVADCVWAARFSSSSTGFVLVHRLKGQNPHCRLAPEAAKCELAISCFLLNQCRSTETKHSHLARDFLRVAWLGTALRHFLADCCWLFLRAIFEEIVFRGFLFRLSAKLLGAWSARVLTSALFDGSYEACVDGVAKTGDPVSRSVWEIHPIYRFEVCRHDDTAHCDVARSADWQPIGKVADIETGDEEKDR